LLLVFWPTVGPYRLGESAPSGDPAILFYDAPSALPLLRRNEAAVRVDRR
jgi:hypothetical protein